MTPDAFAKSINTITADLMATGFCDSANYSQVINDRDKKGNYKKVEFKNCGDISISLRDEPYKDIYNTLLADKQFNLKMIDGAMIQMLYTFNATNDKLLKHRLCYFPAPSFEPYQDEPELYFDESVIYLDVTSKAILPVPIRFDYDPEGYNECVHPASHITLGQYKNCRIPVVAPLCPYSFMRFILQSFYHSGMQKFGLKGSPFILGKTISKAEESMLHISLS